MCYQLTFKFSKYTHYGYVRLFHTSTQLANSVLDHNRILTRLSKSGRVDDARKVFDEMPERDEFSWNTMVSGYANAGRFSEARDIFGNTPCKSSISWNVLISGFCRNGFVDGAFELFLQMLYGGFKPSEYTLGSILGVCSKLGLFRKGQQLHSFAVKTQLDANVCVVTGLVDMYAKCGCILDAECIFQSVSGTKSGLLWSAMLSGYSHNEWGRRAMECFRQMCVEKIGLNEFTFPSILTACAEVAARNFGQQVHGWVIKCGLVDNVYIQSSLLDMYAKCGDLTSARLILDGMEVKNVTAWNSMILGFVREGYEEEAIKYFKKMHALDLIIDDFTYPSILKCFASHFDLKIAGSIHCLTIKTGYEDYNLVSNALVDMYGKGMDIEGARKVFTKMRNKDVISWTSLITAYTQNGLFEQALKLFSDMRSEGYRPDEFLFSSILGACAELLVLKLGQQVHAISMKSGNDSSLFTDNSLISLYSKCGCMDEAILVFESMQVRDLISWTSVIIGYAQNGQGMDSIKYYEEMIANGTKPDSVTFIGLLFACSHMGLVEKGQQYFESMGKLYGLKPGPHHYACMIDLLGRSGKMMEAKRMIDEMEIEPNPGIWKALLSACRVHGNVEMAEIAAKNLFTLEPENAVPYILLANIYSATGRWQKAAQTRTLMRSKAINKEPGFSWMEMEGKVHTFTAADRGHERTVEIYTKVDEIIRVIRRGGYVADKSFDLHDTDDEGKELGLAYHSEKLAVAYALLVSPPRLPIRIFKNIRVCGDCHTAMKFISKVYDRYIILKDPNRFHHFRDGICSCNDYW